MNHDTVMQANESLGVEQEGEEYSLTEMKVRLNNFLWEFLPGKTTLAEAERMACQIFEIVARARSGR